MINENNEAVLFAVQEGVARITLNRPEKRNALNDAMIGGLKELLRRADQDERKFLLPQFQKILKMRDR